jgi:HD superfamily phosphohydrolase YqeK
VAVLVEEWADEIPVEPPERDRWLRAVWLHDALRDAPSSPGVSHGAAAADRAQLEGEADEGVLNAVRYHSIGHPAWDDVGKMLYLADFLEPGRRGRRKLREKLARRVPRNRDRVLRQVLGMQIRALLRRGQAVNPLTLAFWNSLVT